MATSLRPSGRLDPALAAGWKSLPDELKLEIISYIVATDMVFVDSSRRRHLEQIRGVRDWFFLSRQMSQMAVEVFYRRSTFDLTKDYTTRSFWYPKPTVNNLIRNLRLRVDLDPREWEFLQRIASGTLGFRNLQKVEILVHGDSIYARPSDPSPSARDELLSFKEAVQSTAVIFTLKELHVRYVQNLAQNFYPHPLSALFDEVEEIMFRQIGMKPRKGAAKIQEAWTFHQRTMSRRTWY